MLKIFTILFSSIIFLYPLYCNNVFHEKILHGMKKAGIGKLTLPQIKAIPEILKKKNCLIISPTGTGKTEAALLPIFHLFLNLNEEGKGIKILYITPLRALNRDMLQRTLFWGNELGISIAVRHGDTSKHERRKQAHNPPDMLITTPETLQILLIGRLLRNSLKNVRWVIIDEIHELAGNERGWQLSVALERLNKIAKNFQIIGLSATIGNPEEIAEFMGGAEIINAITRKKMHIAVEYLENIDKIVERAKEVIEKHNSTLFFVNTRDIAEILGTKLKEAKVSIEVHHGSLSKEARIEAEEKFKKGEIKALICTSSLELGIDIGRADFILQYNSPRQVSRIIQRVGRSGHGVGRTAAGRIITSNVEEYIEAMVIAKKAMKNEVENIKIRRNPLSVLANQIIAILNEYISMSEDEIYKIIKRAYPFRSLSKKIFMDVMNQLKIQKLLWINELVRKRKKSTFYLIDNISMIPDEKSIQVIDTTSNRSIGKLDESFVSGYCEIGTRFIMRGQAWEIISTDDVIKVAPAKQTNIVPDWTGEDLPVPFEVAQEVGRMRRMAAEGVLKDKVIEKEIKEQLGKKFEVPSDKIITIERERNFLSIVTHFGTKTNETFTKIIGALLSQRFGSIDASSDAYRIYLKLPYAIDANIVKNILMNLKEETIEPLLRIILKKSQFIKWEMVKVARKFGVLEKNADYGSIPIKKLVEVFNNTPLMEEVIDKAIWDRMDIEHAKIALNKIKNGEIKIKVQSLSPISKEGESRKGEFLKIGIDVEMLDALKKRLEETRIKLKCINCGNEIETRVYRAPLKCPKCGSKMLAVVKGGKLEKSASLVANYGKKAILTMAGYGIGTDTAARILAKQKDGYELLKEILKAELNYARTRRFWD